MPPVWAVQSGWHTLGVPPHFVVPAAEKAKFVSEFRASMEDVGKNLDALKAAVEAGKTEDAKSIYEKLMAQKHQKKLELQRKLLRQNNYHDTNSRKK